MFIRTREGLFFYSEIVELAGDEAIKHWLATLHPTPNIPILPTTEGREPTRSVFVFQAQNQKSARTNESEGCEKMMGCFSLERYTLENDMSGR
jgi:hypothetical protein